MCRQRLLPFFLLASLLASVVGCGVITARPTAFSNPETGTGGQTYLLDDLVDIITDEDLTDDEKQDALIEQGIEDPDLIAALLGL